MNSLLYRDNLSILLLKSSKFSLKFFREKESEIHNIIFHDTMNPGTSVTTLSRPLIIAPIMNYSYFSTLSALSTEASHYFRGPFEKSLKICAKKVSPVSPRAPNPLPRMSLTGDTHGDIGDTYLSPYYIVLIRFLYNYSNLLSSNDLQTRSINLESNESLISPFIKSNCSTPVDLFPCPITIYPWAPLKITRYNIFTIRYIIIYRKKGVYNLIFMGYNNTYDNKGPCSLAHAPLSEVLEPGNKAHLQWGFVVLPASFIVELIELRGSGFRPPFGFGNLLINFLSFWKFEPPFIVNFPTLVSWQQNKLGTSW